MTGPMGEVYELAAGDWTASITQVGATLRSLRVGDRDIVTSFPADGRPEHSQGATLAPWPNRLAGGAFELDGRRHDLGCDEGKPFRIHGLVRDVAFDVVEQTDVLLVLGTVIAAGDGWPGGLRLDVAFQVGADGLEVTASAINLSDVVLPLGYGAHPYLVLRDAATATLRIPAEQYLEVDADLLPVALAEVAGTPYDYRVPRPLGRLDTAFTGLQASADGTFRVELVDDGATTTVWGDASMAWVQVYTPGDGGSVAIEPMSCGPDAFNHGDDFGRILLEPAMGVELSWGVTSTM